MIKVPGTEAGTEAIEELIHHGVPVNVTLLFSGDQYRASAEAYLRGLERRLEDGKPLDVATVASVFVSRWDAGTAEQLPEELRNRVGVSMARRCHALYRGILESDRWRRLEEAGAAPQKLLWASTGVKDPELKETHYVEALALGGGKPPPSDRRRREPCRRRLAPGPWRRRTSCPLCGPAAAARRSASPRWERACPSWPAR